jgi:transposase-like protein
VIFLPRPKKSFSPEFKDEAVKMVVETSRPIAKVVKELGINDGTLGNWVGIYRREHAGEEPPLSVSECEAARARAGNPGTEDGKRVPEKSRSILRPRPSVTEKFEFIDAEYAFYQESGDEDVPSVVKMCRWMEVSRSGFYDWRNAPESATAARRGILALYVKKSFDDSGETYGYRRVHADLAGWGVPAGPELVRSVMRELGLEPCQPRPWRFSLTEGRRPGAPDPRPRAPRFHRRGARREDGR